MNSPRSSGEPERAITLTLHAVDIHDLLRGLSVLSKEPHHFDCASPSSDYKALRDYIETEVRRQNPADAANLFEDGTRFPIYPSPPFYPPAREVHHHHYPARPHPWERHPRCAR